MRGAPHRGVGVGHAADEGADRRGDGRATGPVAPALPGPEEPEPGALPAHDGVGLDDGDDLRPAVPEAGEQDPDPPKATRQDAADAGDGGGRTPPSSASRRVWS